MELRHLELLRDIEEHGSITAAARATFRTPSALSQQLRTAQRDLGAELVEHDGRGLRLTEAGRLLAAGATDVATSLQRVQARWDAFRGELSGIVSVAGLPSAAAFLFPALLRAVEGSEIELRLADADLAEAEWSGLVTAHDIVIGHSLLGPRPAGTEGLVVTTIVREPLDVAMSRHHRLAAAEAVRPIDLVDEEWISVPDGYPFRTVLDRIGESTGRPPRISHRLVDNRLTEAIVAAGPQIAILPRFTTPTGHAVPTGEGLVLRPLAGIEATRCISAIMRTDKAKRRAVEHVVGCLIEAGRQAAGLAARSDPAGLPVSPLSPPRGEDANSGGVPRSTAP